MSPKSVEFRIPMPLTLDEYHIALTFMKTRIQMENTSGEEGVEVVESKPFSNEELGSGHYSHVIYHMYSKAPALVRALFPSEALQLEERSWNAFPRSKTILKCPHKRFSGFQVTIRSAYVADRGTSTNALHLSEEELQHRSVKFIDIAVREHSIFNSLIARSGLDPTKFRSATLNRGPLVPGWKETSNPIMTAYKLVTVQTGGWPVQSYVLSGERALFLEAHRKCFCWMDEWSGMTLDDVRKVEKENIEHMRQSLSLNSVDAQPNDQGEPDISQLRLNGAGNGVGGGSGEAQENGSEVEATARGRGAEATSTQT